MDLRARTPWSQPSKRNGSKARGCPWRYRRTTGLLVALTACSVLSCNDADDPVANEEASWIESHAVRFTNASPTSSESSLSELRAVIGDARIVGLGEGTHGTTEFWGIRQKISRYLVEEMGFTAILHEAAFPNSFYIDRYVARGEGTAAEAHEKLGFWRYQEMRTLIDWMRSHNQQYASQGDTLRYFGYDCAYVNWDTSIELISAYLAGVDPSAVSEVEARLNNHTLEDLSWVEDHFEAHAEDYKGAGGEYDFELYRKVLENLESSWVVDDRRQNSLPAYEVRDEYNLETVQWIIDEILNGGKVIIWAHNGHVGNTYLEDWDTMAQMLGSRLRERHGSDYYVVATEFYGGQFRALDRCPGHAYQLITHTAVVPDPQSYPGLLHAEGIPLFFLDLRGVDYSREDTSWLSGPRRMRFIGASYCPEYDVEWYSRVVSLPQEFDGVIYIEQTHPVTPISFAP
jgi:erythromycin esterase